MATVAICLAIGGGLSYFLQSVMQMKLAYATLSGAFLFLVLFLMANFCSCFKASRVQALNETIAEVSQNFVREIEQAQFASDPEKKGGSNSIVEADEQLQQFLIYLESLEILRKMQLAEDLVEVSLKRLQARRVPKTKKYKHNLIEERKILQTSISSVI